MKLPLKFEHATRRIEMMLLEIQLIAVDADEIVREIEEAHESSHVGVDVLDRDAVLAERQSLDRVWHAKTLHSATSQLRSTLESEIRRLREKNPFELGNVRV